MSVQVRRRREAASFLSTFVGAQGELLVDTTSNRVQVHDGVTPGGWAAASIGDMVGRNSILNGTFAINQRSYATGTSLSAGAYAHDRWKAGAGGCTYAFTQNVPDTTVTISAGTLVQTIDAPNIPAASWWLTWVGTAAARVWQGSASGSFGTGAAVQIGGITVNAMLVTGLTISTATSVEFSTGRLGLVQFEAALANAGPTRFERRIRGQETALCEAYYRAYVYGTSGVLQFSGYQNANGFAIVQIVYPLMRAAPTGLIVGTWNLSNVAQMQLGAPQANAVSVSLQATNAGPVSASSPAGGGFTLSAEI